jgi:hypothetical protein
MAIYHVYSFVIVIIIIIIIIMVVVSVSVGVEFQVDGPRFCFQPHFGHLHKFVVDFMLHT